MTAPKRGDIILLDFDPSSGSEITKRRPAIVLSPFLFNDHFKAAFVAPITSKLPQNQFEVSIKTDDVSGSIKIHQTKSIDYQSRRAKIISSAHSKTVSKCLMILKSTLAI